MKNLTLVLLISCILILCSPIKAAQAPSADEITPTEDLMREHGVLRRILLIYEELITRLENDKEFSPEILSKASAIIRNFIEDYHEKLEEDYIFPKFEAANKLTDLVKTLKEQHTAGRKMTDDIRSMSGSNIVKTRDGRRKLAKSLKAFIRMYRPHAAREDTVLFPALHALVSPQEFDTMGDKFEARENRLFGDHGFENVVAEVAQLEQALGIGNLAQFTDNH